MIKSYQFIETRDGRFDAWTKAPEDVARILDQAGCKRIRFGRIPCKSGVFLKLWSRVDWGGNHRSLKEISIQRQVVQEHFSSLSLEGVMIRVNATNRRFV